MYGYGKTGASSDPSSRVRVTRKDTGRAVWVSPETLKEDSALYEKQPSKQPEEKGDARAEGGEILKAIKRPKGWRSEKGESELSGGSLTSWVGEHQARTPKGSAVLGVPHLADPGDKKSPEGKVLYEHTLPEALKVAEKAIKDGKKVVFLGEGQSFVDDLDEEETYNEQHAMAKGLHAKFGDKVFQDTWDGPSVNVFDPKAPLWGKLTRAAGGLKEAQAAIAVFLVGQGDDPKDLRAAGILADDAVDAIKQRFGVDMGKKPKKKDVEKLYRAAFPGDSGEPQNDISALGEVYNAARQDNMLKRIRDIEKEGGVAIVAPGASHAWSLKPHLEAKGKTSAQRVASAWVRAKHANTTPARQSHARTVGTSSGGF